MKLRTTTLVAVVLALAVAACGGSSDGDGAVVTPTASGVTPTVALPTLMDAAATAIQGTPGALPPTQLVGLEAMAIDAEVIVEAHWYQVDGRYAVYFAGLDLARFDSLCLAADGGGGITYPSRVETSAGACLGVVKSLDSPAGLRLCADDVVLVTDIPVTHGGILGADIGYVATFRDAYANSISTVQADLSLAPEVDLAACTPFGG